MIGKNDERQGDIIVKAIVRLKPGFELKEERAHRLLPGTDFSIQGTQAFNSLRFSEKTAVGKIFKRALK